MPAECSWAPDRKSAERTGFEPVVECYPHTGLANRRFRPLSHLSGIPGSAGSQVFILDFRLLHAPGRLGKQVSSIAQFTRARASAPASRFRLAFQISNLPFGFWDLAFGIWDLAFL